MNKLKKYLIINSIFSGFSGLIMMFFSKKMNFIFNINNSLTFPLIGTCLALFSIYVYVVWKKYYSNKLLINIISLLDLIWVIGSVIIIVTDPFHISKFGNIIIGIVAVWISFLCYQQFSNCTKL